MPSDSTHWARVAGPVLAWFSLGIGDMIITWRACLDSSVFGGPSFHPLARIIYFVITFVLLGAAIVAGASCYQTWKRLSGLSKLIGAEGRDRDEFLALTGMFVSLTLGAGMVWLCIPLFIVQMCIRAR
jgi:hypothetical protein